MSISRMSSFIVISTGAVICTSFFLMCWNRVQKELPPSARAARYWGYSFTTMRPRGPAPGKPSGKAASMLGSNASFIAIRSKA